MPLSRIDQIVQTRLACYGGWKVHAACGRCSVDHNAVAVDEVLKRLPGITVGEMLGLLACRRPYPKRRGCGRSPDFVSLVSPAGEAFVLVDKISPSRMQPIFQATVPKRARRPTT